MIFAGFHPENLSHHFSCVSPLRPFETQVQQMSQAQAQDFLMQLYQQMMVQENLYKDLIKEWGIELAVPTWEPASVNLLIASSIQNWGLGDFKRSLRIGDISKC